MRIEVCLAGCLALAVGCSAPAKSVAPTKTKVVVVGNDELQRQCDDGKGAACTRLGHRLGCDRLRAQTRLIAEGELDFIQDACVAGDPSACERIAVEHRDSGYFQKSCEDGDAWACAQLSWMLEYGDGLPEDDERAQTYL